MTHRIRHILEMIRFGHTIFALPFALLAAVMAWHVRASEQASVEPTLGEFFGVIRWQEVIGILVCMVAARSAAMAFNRLADRKIDAENPRTAKRHLPAGVLSLRSVAFFTVFSSLVFVAGTLLFLPNRLPIYLALPVLLFLLAYSYTKRYTALAHVWLGCSLTLAPISTWIALRGEAILNSPADLIPAAMLGVAVLFWVTGFDIIYSCQDVDFDRKSKLRSIPAKLGVLAALRLAAICHLLMSAVLICLPFSHSIGGPQLDLSWIYWSGVGVVVALLAYEHWIVRPDDLTRVNMAFFNINAVVSLGLFVVGTIDLLT